MANPRVAQQYRLNVGTIVEETMIKVRLCARDDQPARDCPTGPIARGGRVLGELEEYFIEGLVPGDTFVFSRRMLRFEAHGRGRGLCLAGAFRRSEGAGLYGRQVSALDLSRRAGARADLRAAAWTALPEQVRNGSASSDGARGAAAAGELLVETFPRGDKSYLVCYPFEGRLAHQTLGMLLTRRLERARLRPLGFVANEYALAVWGLGDPALAIRMRHCRSPSSSTRTCWATISRRGSPKSALMKRTFRQCAIISGLIQRRAPARRRTSGR